MKYLDPFRPLDVADETVLVLEPVGLPWRDPGVPGLGAHVDKAVATRMKEVLVRDRPYVKRSAWIGVESVPKVYYENIKTFSQRDFPPFKTREEAMDWLTEE